MRVIVTLSSLYLKPGELWDHHMRTCGGLNTDQRAAIAGFLSEMAIRDDLGHEDRKVVVRALQNYWKTYLS